MKKPSGSSQNDSNIEQNKDLYIIAIGASAGGMEAIHLLFDHTPEDGVAYIIIQHLSRDHKSFMAELLAKHSKLQISEAENDMIVEPNQVYLMPKGMNMTIRNRRLLLTESRAQQPNTAIDIFLNSLAEDQRDKSIAIILSGTGSDGTKGIGAIKKMGGMVIVQDPGSAKFDGMPNSAIESGNVDVILPPEKIPLEIISYLQRDILENIFTDKITEADENVLLEILDLIQEHTPLDFTNYKRPTIIRRIVIRMTQNNLNTLDAYVDFLKANPAEINVLAKEFLISVTQFFRDPEAFELINEKVIPGIIENKLFGDTLKVWVVGCATGEEAFSLAILIMEHLTERKKNLEVKIFASDIDKSALAHAAKGIYSARSIANVSEDRLKKYFIKEDNKYRIRENIRKMIIFADHDIVKQPPYGKIDLISCRNLLIYLNPLLQNKILTSLHFCLNMDGYLFLGPSESLGDLKRSFAEVDKKWKVYKSTEMVRNVSNTTYSTPGHNKKWINSVPGLVPSKNVIKSNLSEIIKDTLLEESGYEAGVCVDEDFKIIESFGDIDKYLLPKIFTFDLLEMLPNELAIATAPTLRKAVSRNKMAIIKNVQFRKNESLHSVNVFIKPFLSGNISVITVILVLFSGDAPKKITEKDSEIFDRDAHTERYLEDMKSELSETKQRLTESFEALELSNDNISSYNEELISSNEELQSTNEELQSVNEELQTVNNEYQLKIKELAELNDDLNNYFKSTTNGQIYVDKNHIVRKFTPSAVEQVNLKESDAGRALSDISTNIQFATLTNDINVVISSTEAREKEIQTTNGKWYQMKIIPYVKQNNENDGAIITFNDITELKLIQDKLKRINADLDTFIYSAAHDLKGPLTNISVLIAFLQESQNSENPETKEMMDMVHRAVKNLVETIDELSDIANIDNEIDAAAPVNVQKIIEEVKLGIKNKLINSKAKIHHDLKVVDISFSKKHLRSILSNLIGNAIKYKSPDRNPVVTIKTERISDHIVLSVQDNGLGLGEGKIRDIFTKFTRRHSHVEGNGIGLFLVKKIMDNAGGEIIIESELGKGSTFKIYFQDTVDEKSV